MKSKRMKSMRVLLLMLLAVFSLSVSAQTITITGSVKDATGEPIIGASVVQKGNTSNGTITNLDGVFSIKTPANASLEVSYIGMKTQVVAVSGKTKINVTLSDDTKALDGVIVIGYGTAKRKDITGSVATVNSEVLAAVPVASAMEALTGKMAGVQITTTEGSPDADIRIRVRGGGSITGDNTPLFIVDGFPVESISDIPASEIADMTVLKDASSTAIYGSRGANGVILVTTKSGQAGKVTVNYNAYYSWKKMAKKLNTLSPGDYTKWQYELAMLDANTPDAINPTSYTDKFGNFQDIDLYNDVAANDWQDLVFGNIGHTFNHNLSISGGGDKIKYAFNYAHMDDKAIMDLSDFKRDNLSLKVNSKPHKRVTLDFSVRYSNTLVNGGGANESKNEVSSADSRMKDVMIYSPFNFKDLSSGYDSDMQLTNPLVSLADNDRQQKRQTFNYAGSFAWEVIDNLTFKTELGLDHYYNKDDRFYGTTTYNARTNSVKDKIVRPLAAFKARERKAVRNTNTLNYDFKKLFKSENHNLNIMVGQELIRTKSKTDTDDVILFPELFTAHQAFALSTQGQASSTDKFYNVDNILLSYFGRANYNYQDKYLATATFRADGSSKFSPDNRWGYFPSAAVAWRISSESFMENTKSWLDDLKLRASYGTAGNDGIPGGQIERVWSGGSGSSLNWMNGISNYWTPGKTMPNKDLKWETTYTRNFGLDFTLLNGKLSGTIEYYWNNTKDLLLEVPVSGSGYATQFQNLGKTENKGFEVTLNWDAINKKNFGLNLSANIGFNKNNVVSMGSLDMYPASSGWASSEISNDFIVKPGHPIGEIYGYVSDGRYEVSDFEGFIDGAWVLKPGVANNTDVIGKNQLRPGALKLKNIDGSEDNAVTTTDQQVIGDTNPVATGGFAINARAYGFDLSANFAYSIGNDIYNANKVEYTSTSKYPYRNMIDVMSEGKRWTNLNADGTISNDPAQLEAMNAGTTMWSPWMKAFTLTDWAIEDGSFLRLSTLSIGYTLPQTLTQKVNIQNLRFYVTGYNLLCWTKYSGFDPEVSTRSKSPLTPGVDYSAYPKSRQCVIGLNLTF